MSYSLANRYSVVLMRICKSFAAAQFRLVDHLYEQAPVSAIMTPTGWNGLKKLDHSISNTTWRCNPSLESEFSSLDGKRVRSRQRSNCSVLKLIMHQLSRIKDCLIENLPVDWAHESVRWWQIFPLYFGFSLLTSNLVALYKTISGKYRSYLTHWSGQKGSHHLMSLFTR